MNGIRDTFKIHFQKFFLNNRNTTNDFRCDTKLLSDIGGGVFLVYKVKNAKFFDQLKIHSFLRKARILFQARFSGYNFLYLSTIDIQLD